MWVCVDVTSEPCCVITVEAGRPERALQRANGWAAGGGLQLLSSGSSSRPEGHIQSLPHFPRPQPRRYRPPRRPGSPYSQPQGSIAAL